MKKALLLNAVDPTIGGVLIRGEKGTGKSTAVRALADLLPEIEVVADCPFNCHPSNLRLMCKSCQERFKKGEKLPVIKRKMQVVDLPLSATEDKVVGTIDIQRVLKEGIKALEPGILAKANRNILYIDEVNLLDDHLVNVLLDAAAMGVNVVEREGISLYHPSRFILVGTMNPEEGSLRPQLLDRFGLCVDVEAITDPDQRLKIIEYRQEFDRDPWLFEKKFEKQQEALRQKVVNARRILPEVKVSKELRKKMIELVLRLGIKTHRADIVLEKTAKALAAFKGKKRVSMEDVKEAALLALPHRLRQEPFSSESLLSREDIERLLEGESPSHEVEVPKEGSLNETIFQLFEGEGKGRERGNKSEHGKYVKAKQAREVPPPSRIALLPTLKKSVAETGTLEVQPFHIMEKVLSGASKTLCVVCLDSSGSMRSRQKILFVKNLAWLLLKRNYQRKNRMALIGFENGKPKVFCKPTTDPVKIEQALEKIPVGGKTPLTAAILEAFELLKKAKKEKPLVFIVSDGRPNVFIRGSLDADLELLKAELPEGARIVFVNAEPAHQSIGILERMASVLGGVHLFLNACVKGSLAHNIE